VFETTLLIERFPYLGIFLLLLFGEIGLPFPEDATLILTGVLTARGVLKPLPAVILLYLGLLVTDFVLYSVGRKYGRKVVEHRKFQKIISSERLKKLEDQFTRWGVWVVFLGRHVVGIRAQLFLATGVMKMPAIRFLLADAISALITIGIWGGIGYLGGNSVHALLKGATRIEYIVIVIVFILVAGGVFFAYFKAKRR
jgi:membrane protein DedA with SNARE-associated domain